MSEMSGATAVGVVFLSVMAAMAGKEKGMVVGRIVFHAIEWSFLIGLVTVLTTDGIRQIGLHGEMGDTRHHIMIERFWQADVPVDDVGTRHVLSLVKSH